MSRRRALLALLLAPLLLGASAGAPPRVKRSSSVRRRFARDTPCPYAAGDCIADHIVPLKRGGADAPHNMQWQTREAARAKDRIE